MHSDLGLVQVTNFHGSHADLSDPAVLQERQIADEAIDIRLLSKEFVSHFRIGSRFLYVEMLRENLAAGLFFIEVQMAHLQQYSGVLLHAVQHSPTRSLPIIEHAVSELAHERKLFPLYTRQSTVQVQLYWGVPPISLRHLAQATVAKLVCASGIVVKASSSHARCVRAAIQCTSCRSKSFVSGGRSVDLPPQCVENAGRQGGGMGSSGK